MAFDNATDDIKKQLNIVDVIGREVKLKKTGSGYTGLCPFHGEKTPSFSVNEKDQYYHCFGCGVGGDVFKFAMEYYKLSFVEAVEKLCTDYGIKPPEWGKNENRIDREKYYRINATAARFYYNCLGRVPNEGISYLMQRGLTKETITAFGLGFAPSSGSALTDYLRSEGVSDEDILFLGLANEGRNGLYDKFRGRVIFPIIDINGKVIGFGGRALGDFKPKYLNSSESDIFLKKNNLFGLNLTRKEISNADKAIIVEGYMDLISLYQSGIKNVAASLGTALTDNQARLLCRYTKNIVLSYDSDAAGVKAAMRGISVINGAGGKARVLSVSDGKDPDDYVKKHGREGFLKLVDDAVPATDFRLNQIAEGFNLDDDIQVLEYIDEVVPVLKSLGPVEQDMYIRKLAGEFGISEHAIELAVSAENDKDRQMHKPAPAVSEKAAAREPVVTNRNLLEKIEMSFLLLSMNNVKYLKRFEEDGIEFRTTLANSIKAAEIYLSRDLSAGEHGIKASQLAQALDPDEESVFRRYLDTIEIGPDDEDFYKKTKAGYLINNCRAERSEVMNELAVAEKLEKTEDIERLASRLIDLDKLINELTEVSNA